MSIITAVPLPTTTNPKPILRGVTNSMGNNPPSTLVQGLHLDWIRAKPPQYDPAQTLSPLSKFMGSYGDSINFVRANSNLDAIKTFVNETPNPSAITPWNEWDLQDGVWTNDDDFFDFSVTLIKDLRKEAPNVPISWPAMGHYDATRLSAGLAYLALNGASPDYLDWHENGAASDISGIDSRIGTMLADPNAVPVFISEWGGEATAFHPGAFIGYLATMSQRGIVGAARADWGGLLGGLLIDNGSNNPITTSCYDLLASLTSGESIVINQSGITASAWVSAQHSSSGRIKWTCWFGNYGLNIARPEFTASDGRALDLSSVILYSANAQTQSLPTGAPIQVNPGDAVKVVFSG